jgi:hypothetical protein
VAEALDESTGGSYAGAGGLSVQRRAAFYLRSGESRVTVRQTDAGSSAISLSRAGERPAQRDEDIAGLIETIKPPEGGEFGIKDEVLRRAAMLPGPESR